MQGKKSRRGSSLARVDKGPPPGKASAGIEFAQAWFREMGRLSQDDWITAVRGKLEGLTPADRQQLLDHLDEGIQFMYALREIVQVAQDQAPAARLDPPEPA